MNGFEIICVRSRYSLLQSQWSITELVEDAAKRNVRRLALCDFGTLAGVPSFARACRRVGVVPIAGCELPVRRPHGLRVPGNVVEQVGRFFDSETENHAASLGESTLPTLGVRFIATSGPGFRNLIALSTAAYGRRTRFPCPVAVSLLRTHAEGLLLFTGEDEHGGEMGRAVVDRRNQGSWLFHDELRVNLQRGESGNRGHADNEQPAEFDIRVQQAAQSGLQQRMPGAGREYAARLEHELAVFEQGGWSEYLLILAEITRFCRERGIEYSRGRGAAPGSLLLYCLGVTNVDPVEHGLIFERLYNRMLGQPLRSITLDVASGRRDEIVEHLTATYGSHRVARIAAHVTLRSKRMAARLRQTGREGEITHYYSRWEKHQPGIALAPQTLAGAAPFYFEQDGGSALVQYPAEDLAEAGLYRIDMLEMRARPGKGVLDTPAAREVIRRTRPQSHMDYVHIEGLLTVSLRCPELGLVERFVAAMQDPDSRACEIAGAEDILGESCGLLIYQEQAIQVLHRLAGWSLEYADLARTIIATKDAKAIDRVREEFVSDALALERGSGMTKKEVRDVFGLLLERVSCLVLKGHEVGGLHPEE